jgi:hypothetical protein
VRVIGDVPDVPHAARLEKSVNVLADTDEPVAIAAREPEEL